MSRTNRSAVRRTVKVCGELCMQKRAQLIQYSHAHIEICKNCHIHFCIRLLKSKIFLHTNFEFITDQSNTNLPT